MSAPKGAPESDPFDLEAFTSDNSSPDLQAGPESAPAERLRVEDDKWREQLIRKKGAVLPTIPNVVTILRYHSKWRGVFAYDAFAEDNVILSAPPWHPIDAPAEVKLGAWRDSDTTRVVDWLSREEHLSVTAKTVEAALAVVAESTIVHPVRDYLNALRWDGQIRLETFLPIYFGTEKNAYTCGVGLRWMISAVARVMRPGCQADCTLLVESRQQGTGKTSGFRELVHRPEWYADSGINIDNKDSYDALRSVWIYGLDELDSLHRGELTKWKSFLTSTCDHYRPPYGKRARDFPRQTVFCGTTNEDQYLPDKTGNRRFWPVRVLRPVDVEAIRRDRDKLWAEARTRFEGNEPWHVNTAEFRELCEAQQAERVQADDWEPVVQDWLRDPKAFDPDHKVLIPFPTSQGVRTVDVLRHALKVKDADITKADTMRVGTVLRSLGYQRERDPAGNRDWRYVPAKEAGRTGETP